MGCPPIEYDDTLIVLRTNENMKTPYLVGVDKF